MDALFDKVAEGLKHCGSEELCDNCRYLDKDAETEDAGCRMFADALALIRQQRDRITELEAAQTARVMTLEEVHEMAWDYCYLEEEVIGDNVLKKYCGNHRVKCITWPSIASCVLTHGDDAYGKRWRCWTQHPTEEQRKEADWG